MDEDNQDDVLAQILVDPEAFKAPRSPRSPGPSPEDEPDPQAPEEEAPDAEPGSEEAPEEAAAEIVTEDNIDDYLVEVTVDGQTVEVPLKELKKGFSGNRYIEKNVQRAVETRKVVEAEAERLYTASQMLGNKLQNVDAILQVMASPNIDWEKLRATDPQAFILKREEVRDAQEKQQVVRQEIQRVQAEQERLASDAQQRYLADQAEALVARLPEMADPKKAAERMGSYTEAAKRYGYTRQELETISDHRVILALDDLAKYHALLAKNRAATAPATNGAKKVLLRAGATKPAVQAARKLDKDALTRARRTGRAEDVAATLLMRK